MTFWQKNKWKIIAPVLIVLVLAAAFVFGDQNIPAQPTPAEQPTVSAPAESTGEPAEPTPEEPTPEEPADVPTAEEPEQADESAAKETEQPDEPAAEEPPAELPEFQTPAEMGAGATGEYEEINGMMIDTGTGKDKYLTDPVPEGRPAPVEPEDAEVSDAEYTCTLSISCATILDNMDLCKEEKRELVPEDGWILKPMTVTFYEGESVFNVLQRTCKQQKIHMEFVNTPAYHSAYIEGIHNLYEFDVGNLSGWMYKVNDWFPNYGCSRYRLQDGDVVEWKYTCDLGSDVGGGSAVGG
ncbi:hypothetical protein [Oscillospiraceae bacterium]|nr:hypothetical protein [Oscillospiraceae bacterium]